MEFMIGANALANAIGKLIYNYLYNWVEGWSDSWTIVGAFSITVIMFTIFLKVVVFPLDLWQKHAMRKNKKKMDEMRPALERLQKQCGSNRELLMQKQRALYKEHHYSMFGSCLPMIVTMAVFFIVFSGFNAAVEMRTTEIYNGLHDVYYEAYYEARDNGQDKAGSTEAAETAVLNAYAENYKESFFWVKNIFAADNWADTIPNAGSAQSKISNLDTADYEIVMKPLMNKYNEGWNGYMILPIVCLLLNIASMFLNKSQMQQPAVPGQTEEQAKSQQTQSKIMQFIMPVMMFIFALFYSSAFTLYMIVNMFFTTVINLVYNIVTKRIDAREEDMRLRTTYKK